MHALNELLPQLLGPPGLTTTLVSGTLSGLRHKPAGNGDYDFTRADIKPVMLKGRAQFQVELRYPKKRTHRNFEPDAAVTEVQALLDNTFTQAIFHTADADFHLILSKAGHWTVRRKVRVAELGGEDAVAAASLEHNRQKNYILPVGKPIPFLIRLGVMTADGRVIAAKYDKFRQINRFLEMVVDTLASLPKDQPLRIIDFGSGKSYLTFALYHLLCIEKGLDVKITGLDLKRDVIEACNVIAVDLGWNDRLRFEVGDIAGYAEASESVDMVVSLHACDTATDDALAKAVGWGASVILCVPCCQHELFKKIENAELRPLLKHGLFRERLASLVTDALRAGMLERRGYQVNVLEFIDIEHTPKNLLIRAVRHSGKPSARLDEEYVAFRNFWAVTPYIDGVMGVASDSQLTSAPDFRGLKATAEWPAAELPPGADVR